MTPRSPWSRSPSCRESANVACCACRRWRAPSSTAARPARRPGARRPVARLRLAGAGASAPRARRLLAHRALPCPGGASGGLRRAGVRTRRDGLPAPVGRARRPTAPDSPICTVRSTCFAVPPCRCWRRAALSEHTVTATGRVAQRAAREGLALVVGGMKSTHRIAAATARAAGAARLVVLDRGLFAAFGGQLAVRTVRLGSRPVALRPGRDARALGLSTQRSRHAAQRPPPRRAHRRARRRRRGRQRAAGRRGGAHLPARARPRTVRAQLAGQEPSLLAAGAVPIDPRTLDGGLRRFLR